MDFLLRLEGIRYAYPGKASPVLRGASLELTPETRLGLTGVNGGGKSTLLHVAAGLLRPEAGTIAFKDAICRSEKDFAALRLRLGYLLQHAEDQLFCPTVLEDVAFGPYNQGHGRQEAERIARATLERMDLSRLAGLSGADLSGGEKKMAALATILSMRPDMLFLDEPSNDLDPAGREKLLRLLAEDKLPCVIISHDRELLDRACNALCLLEDGTIRPLPDTPRQHGEKTLTA
jgi:cobalt/nickel transport system ATP-binding protein